jgi:photosystem II stability/assembly factor-like uncharacterized protein
VRPIKVSGLASFSVIDLSFVSTEDGWVLGTGACPATLAAVAGLCAALAATTDGGRTWSRATPPTAYVLGSKGCFDPCVEHVLFASSRLGYAYGRTSLFMTTDRGRHWTREPGHADALAIVAGTVIRVSAPCCAPAARYQVQLARVGSASWRPSPVPGGLIGDAVAVTSGRADAYLELYENPAGGAGHARSTLYASTDDGRTWVRHDEPCAQVAGGTAGNEIDSTAITAAADGSVSVLCEPRGGAPAPFTITSTDNARTFKAPSARLPDTTVGIASLSAFTIFGCGEQLDRSTDSGRTWTAVARDAQGNCTMAFPTTSTGYWIAPASQTIWTTHNAGLTWTPFTFG